MNSFKCGIVSVSFRSLSASEIVKAVSEAGLDCIEWGSDVHAPCNNDEALTHIAELQKEYGITCSSYGTYFRFQKNDISELPLYIKAAKTLGTDILRLWCGIKGSKSYNEEEKEELFRLCREAADMAKKEGVYFCMECHSGTYTDTLDSALELMEAINSPHFRMFWQINQLKDFDYNIQYAKKIKPYTYNLHVFYFKDDVKVPIVNGKDDWQKYLEVFGGGRALLLEFLFDNRIESLPSEAKALKDFAQGIN